MKKGFTFLTTLFIARAHICRRGQINLVPHVFWTSETFPPKPCAADDGTLQMQICLGSSRFHPSQWLIFRVNKDNARPDMNGVSKCQQKICLSFWDFFTNLSKRLVLSNEKRFLSKYANRGVCFCPCIGFSVKIEKKNFRDKRSLWGTEKRSMKPDQYKSLAALKFNNFCQPLFCVWNRSALTGLSPRSKPANKVKNFATGKHLFWHSDKWTNALLFWRLYNLN